MRLRESATRTPYGVATVVADKSDTYRRQTGQEREPKMISTMAQFVKNCCLGGLKAGTEAEGKQQRILCLSSPLSPFWYFNQVSFISRYY
jgi:hypothetical protein